MAGVVDLSRVRRKQEYFCERRWTARSVICPSGNSPLHLQSYKGRALIDFARCEVRYAAHFGNDVDTGVAPRSANIGSRGPYKFGACRSREIGQADCFFSDRLWCLQSASAAAEVTKSMTYHYAGYSRRNCWRNSASASGSSSTTRTRTLTSDLKSFSHDFSSAAERS
jgi:hypothetical protein